MSLTEYQNKYNGVLADIGANAVYQARSAVDNVLKQIANCRYMISNLRFPALQRAFNKVSQESEKARNTIEKGISTLQQISKKAERQSDQWRQQSKRWRILTQAEGENLKNQSDLWRRAIIFLVILILAVWLTLGLVSNSLIQSQHCPTCPVYQTKIHIPQTIEEKKIFSQPENVTNGKTTVQLYKTDQKWNGINIIAWQSLILLFAIIFFLTIYNLTWKFILKKQEIKISITREPLLLKQEINLQRFGINQTKFIKNKRLRFD